MNGIPMLDAIRDFFDRQIRGSATTEERHSIELATAALLVEVLRLDGGIGPAEREVGLALVRGKFALTDNEARTLFDLAEAEARQATDYYQFTSIINEQFTPAQKLRVVELLWESAFADGNHSAHEQHLVRKLANLLHVPHRDYINAKLKARQGGAGP